MKYIVAHKTTYTYFEPVSMSHHVAKLVPRDTDRQCCRNVHVKIHPQPDNLNEYIDFFGNKVIYFSVEKEHTQLTVSVRTEIDKDLLASREINLYNNTTIETLKKDLAELRPELAEIRQFIFATPMTEWNEDVAAYALQSFTPGRPVFEAARDLMRRIHTDFEFKPGFTTVSTPLSVAMRERKGVCQDFAHLAVACVRSVGLPARYVSGYIETISPPGVEKLYGVDASHAWFSVYITNMGWVDFDPTNNIIPGDQYITIGWGREYADVAPLKGIILSSGSHALKVSVDVKREG